MKTTTVMAAPFVLRLCLTVCLVLTVSTRIIKQKQYPGCPDGCECESSTTVVCDSQGVDLTYIPSVPIPTTKLLFRTNTLGDVYRDTFQNISAGAGIKIQVLDLSDNDITSISPMAFSRLTYLKKLDLSKNFLHYSDGLQKALVSLKHINIQHLLLKEMGLQDESIPSNIFEPFTTQNALQTIDLSQNKLGVFDVRMLINLTALQELSLNQNRLFVFMGPSEEIIFPVLKKLDLRSNSFTEIPLICPTRNAIFPNLTTFLLEDNFITNFYAKDLRCLCNVHELSLGQNPSVFVPENLIKEMSSLRILRMNYMLRVPIKISPTAFTSQSLEELSLAGNELNTDILSQKTFTSLDNLIRLDLAGNEFNSLSFFESSEISKFFPPNLQDLSLRNCRLDSLPKIIHKKLTQLDVSENKIAKLEKGVFSDLPNLTILNLNSNRLTKVNESAFPPELRDRLTAVGTDNNPLICSCAISWLRDWMKKEAEKFFEIGYVNGCIKLDTSEPISIIDYKQDCTERHRNVILIASVVTASFITGVASFLVIYYRKSIKFFCYMSSRRRDGAQLVTDSDTSSVI
ncbi:protein slit [Patella vulgata]|uniref:protein slit n=1 Tax=Patella vulgata TaxID=6465 RepID=UPI0024A9AE0D|nr:protein slit [Patella vulgata]